MPEKTASLYARLGGYEAIAAVVDNLLPRHREDSLLHRFWTSPRSMDTNTGHTSWQSILSPQPGGRRSISDAT
jgi:hypothetical protein